MIYEEALQYFKNMRKNPETQRDKEAADIAVRVMESMVTGTWKKCDEGKNLYVCSKCGSVDSHKANVKVPYCWHCGAEMFPDWDDTTNDN